MVTASFVVGGTQSGVGKTSVALGLVAALVRRGLRVQTFKVGPDYLDPGWLARASGRPCYNLDPWMTGESYLRELFAQRSAHADVAVIEGVMGLFDGPPGAAGSTADVARLLDAPVLLVLGAHGLGRSVAAMVSGYTGFEDGLGFAGLVANRCGSSSHGSLLEAALAQAELPPLLGAIPREALPGLPSRHLGLVRPDDRAADDRTCAALADAIERHVNVEALLPPRTGAGSSPPPAAQREPAAAAPPASPRSRRPLRGSIPSPVAPTVAGAPPRPSRARIGVARDAAFHFYYADDLEALQTAGAQVVFFSPLADRGLPDGVTGLWFGGGYPEEHAAALAANRGLAGAVRRFGVDGGPIYAECGGLMYLAREITDRHGQTFPMVGLLPGSSRMRDERRALGYVEVTLQQDSLWGTRGTVLRGHEFHFSEWESDLDRDGWRPAYSRSVQRTGEVAPVGLERDRVLASYVHLHHASRPDAVARFVHICGGT